MKKDLTKLDEVDNLFDLGFEKIPISLVSFKADSFSSTLRPNALSTSIISSMQSS